MSKVLPDLYYFQYFVWLASPIVAIVAMFIVAIDFPTCFATVADRSAMHGQALEEMARN